MTTLPPPDAPAVFWIDPHGQQQGPEPLNTVIERIAFQQIPSTTPVWWQGAANWIAFDSVAEFAGALQQRLQPAAPAPAPTPSADPAATLDPGGTQESASAFAAEPTIEPTIEPAIETTRLFDADATIQDPAASGSSFGSSPVAEPVTTGPGLFESPDLAPVDLDPIVLADPNPVSAFGAPVDAVPVDAVPIIEPLAAAPIAEPATEPVIEAIVEPTSSSADSDLDAVFSELQARAQPFVDEQTRVAALNDTLSAMVRTAAEHLGHQVVAHDESNGYHMFGLRDASGTPFSLAVTQVPYADTVAEAVARPVGVHVDRGGRASAYLYLGDYLDSMDQALLDRHIAAIIHAAGR
ncbi:MAG TPA: DUF4339 domain-containing protein [Microthrixaceae bacterium]|nr:DUF4339 domain-containing protein [Microthrixaceae bacterium]